MSFQPTPKMKTTISKIGQSLVLVRVESEKYGIATTTMSPPVTHSDLRVENLKRQLAHLPQIKPEAEPS